MKEDIPASVECKYLVLVSSRRLWRICYPNSKLGLPSEPSTKLISIRKTLVNNLCIYEITIDQRCYINRLCYEDIHC